VTADLPQVGSLKVQSELHQDVGNVVGRRIGKREVLQCLGGSRARHRSGSRLLLDSLFGAEALASMMTLSTLRSRMAEVKVLSLLKICGQCL
jgi:hypothetical protein